MLNQIISELDSRVGMDKMNFFKKKVSERLNQSLQSYDYDISDGLCKFDNVSKSKVVLAFREVYKGMGKKK